MANLIQIFHVLSRFYAISEKYRFKYLKNEV